MFSSKNVSQYSPFTVSYEYVRHHSSFFRILAALFIYTNKRACEEGALGDTVPCVVRPARHNHPLHLITPAAAILRRIRCCCAAVLLCCCAAAGYLFLLSYCMNEAFSCWLLLWEPALHVRYAGVVSSSSSSLSLLLFPPAEKQQQGSSSQAKVDSSLLSCTGTVV